MKSLRRILLELEAGQQTVPQPGVDQNQIELPKYNLVISVMEKEKKLNFSPLNSAMPVPQARTLINELKSKFKVSLVQQQTGNVFIVTLDPREDLFVVLDYLQQQSEI